MKTNALKAACVCAAVLGFGSTAYAQFLYLPAGAVYTDRGTVFDENTSNNATVDAPVVRSHHHHSKERAR